MDIMAFLGMGFVSGIRHALENDHLAAVAALVSRSKKLRHALYAGSWWGLGHTATLMLVGLAVLGLGMSIPAGLVQGMELLVAFMLVSLGIMNIRLWMKSREVHLHRHEHDDHDHLHLHGHPGGQSPHAHEHKHAKNWRSFVVGSIHGIAGSAAITLLVLSSVRSVPLGMAYILVFGFGSVLGMALFSLALGLPAKLAGDRISRIDSMASAIGGVLALFVGSSLAIKTLPQLIF